MSENLHFHEIEAGADNSRAMETDTIQKNGASPKSLMSRWKFPFTLLILIAIIFFSACKKDPLKNDVNRNIAGTTETGEAVMVMDTTMLSSKLVEITPDGTLIINNLAAADMPQKGDIICSAPSKNAPQGFLYRVKEVKTNDNKTTIVTEFATIEEAVEEAEADQILDMTITDIEDVEGVEIVELKQSRISIGAGIKLNIDTLINENVHIKGTIELKSTLRCVINIKGFKLNRFELSTQPQFKAQLAATYEGKVEKNIKFPITTINCAPVTVWVGIVPVVFTPKISIAGVFTSKGEVKIQATLVDWDYSYTVGIRYQNGKLEAISENTSQPAKYLEDAQLVLTGEMKLQAQLSYRYALYNSGTYAGLTGDLYAKLKVTDNVGSYAKLSFSCGLEFGADAELKILSYKLGKLNTTFLSTEWLIWEKIWGLGDDGISYILDNGYAWSGWHALPTNNVSYWLGNKFIVGESGVLTSIDLWSANWNDGGSDYVTIEIFNESRTMVGSSSQFVLPDHEWKNVTLNQVPYSGTFYVMVRWSAYSKTNFVGIDLAGPNAHKRLAYQMNNYEGWQVLEDKYGSDNEAKGVFLIRANAIVLDKSVHYGNEDDLPKENPSNLFKQSNMPYVGGGCSSITR